MLCSVSHCLPVQNRILLISDTKTQCFRLLRQYEAEAAKLEREIAAYYKRYGEDNIVKYADLFKKLPDSDIMLLIQRMDEFEKKYPEYADLMPIRESIYKLNRLEGVATEHTPAAARAWRYHKPRIKRAFGNLGI